MESGVTIFCIDSGNYIYYLEVGEVRYILHYNNSNKGRCIGERKKKEETKRTTRYYASST